MQQALSEWRQADECEKAKTGAYAMRTWIAVGIGVLLSGAQPSAHHAFAAEYDANQKITLQGTIVKMDWVNPHAWLSIDVKGSDGTVEQWVLEFGAPNALYRRGWRKDSLPVGSDVTVVGYRAKNGSRTVNARDVILPDGKKLFAGSSGTGAPDDPKERY